MHCKIVHVLENGLVNTNSEACTLCVLWCQYVQQLISWNINNYVNLVVLGWLACVVHVLYMCVLPGWHIHFVVVHFVVHVHPTD